MTHKEIEQYRKKLIEIISRKKQPDGNPAKGTKEDLQELAKRVGASTRAIYTDRVGTPTGIDACISDLIDNIHTSLQTAAMIDVCKTAAQGYEIATEASRNAIKHYWIAVAIAVLSAVAAWVAVLVAAVRN